MRTSWPRRQQESVRQAELPDVSIIGTCELSAVGGRQTHLMWKVVLSAGVDALRIHTRQPVAAARLQPLELLNASERLQSAPTGVHCCRFGKTSTGFQPVALAAWRVGVFRLDV